jgi:hypothetical protein
VFRADVPACCVALQLAAVQLSIACLRLLLVDAPPDGGGGGGGAGSGAAGNDAVVYIEKFGKVGETWSLHRVTRCLNRF